MVMTTEKRVSTCPHRVSSDSDYSSAALPAHACAIHALAIRDHATRVDDAIGVRHGDDCASVNRSSDSQHDSRDSNVPQRKRLPAGKIQHLPTRAKQQFQFSSTWESPSNSQNPSTLPMD
jgi:hypothetical protein